jgi:hypothetical protein
VHDGEIAAIPQRLQRREARVESEEAVEVERSRIAAFRSRMAIGPRGKSFSP